MSMSSHDETAPLGALALHAYNDDSVDGRSIHAVDTTVEPTPDAQADADAAEAPVDAPLLALQAAIDGLLDSRRPGLFQLVEETLVRAAFVRCGENQVQSA